MSMHIVDDEQRGDRRASPMRPSGSGLAGTSAALALLDDVHRHRLRRAALHLPPPGQERDPFCYSDRLLERGFQIALHILLGGNLPGPHQRYAIPLQTRIGEN